MTSTPEDLEATKAENTRLRNEYVATRSKKKHICKSYPDITYNGETHPLSVWGDLKRELGRETLYRRYKAGDRGEALFRPNGKHSGKKQAKRDYIKVDYNGESLLLTELAELVDIDYRTLYRRLQSGDTGDHLVRPKNTNLGRRPKLVATYRGETRTLVDWAITLKLPYLNLCKLYKAGYRDAQLFEAVEANQAEQPVVQFGQLSATFNGETRPLTEWAKIVGINYNVLLPRYKKGERGEKLFRPVNKDPRTNRPDNILINGVPLKQLADDAGLDYKVVYARYKRGDSVEKLFRPLTTKH